MKDELSPELRALLQENSEGPPLPEAARARVLGRVLTTVAVSATAATAAGASASISAVQTGASAASAAKAGAAKAGATASAAVTTKVAAAGGVVAAAGSATLSAVVVKGAIGVVLVASTVGGGAWVLRERPASQAATVAAAQAAGPVVQPAGITLPTAATGATPVELDLSEAPSTPSSPLPGSTPPTGASSTPPDRSAPPRRSSVAVSSENAPPASGVDTTTAESALLQRARAALASGNPTKSLTILEDHARSYAAGLLVEERDGLRVVALARAGRRQEARASAADFAARYPQSLLLPTVEAATRP